MKSNHNLIIPFLNKKQTISKENIAEIKSDIDLYEKTKIDISELVRKLEILVSQFCATTKTFSIFHEYNFIPKTTIPFISDIEGKWSNNYIEVWDGVEPIKSVDILQAKKKIEFDYREKINDYDKETISFANVLNKLFGYISVSENLKELILEASAIPSFKKELENITIYKNIKFSDLRCVGTIYDKLDEYFITSEALRFAIDMTTRNKEFDKKGNVSYNKIEPILRKTDGFFALVGGLYEEVGELSGPQTLLNFWVASVLPYPVTFEYTSPTARPAAPIVLFRASPKNPIICSLYFFLS